MKLPLTINLLPVLLLIYGISPGLMAQNRPAADKHAKLPDYELHLLDEAMQNTKKYDAAKKNRIDSLQVLIRKTPSADADRVWHLAMEIGDQFKVFSADSALNYYSEARNIATRTNNTDHIIRSRAAIVGAFAAAGIFTEAVPQLDSLELMLPSLQLPLKTEIYKSGRQLYSYMGTYVDDHQHYEELYLAKFHEYTMKLLSSMPDNDPFKQFVRAEYLINEGRYREAKQTLERLLKTMPDHSNLYGMAAYQMAEVYKNQGDETEAARYMALAAISDLKGSVKEGVALPQLARWLYEQGEVDRAFSYINLSLEDAMAGNARMRTAAIARFVPLIDNAYRHKISSSRDELMIYFLLVTFLLLISAALLILLFRQMKRLKAAKEKLTATSKLQDSYIGNFLGMCSSYASRLESVNKLVSRKIAAGQTDELLKMMKSGKFTEEQTDDFMQIFDNAFLDLYPNFIDDVNKLLRPEEQLDVKKGHSLPTELRIYAFVRLGVDESTKIARILHYSVSTVYTYRNKMRNKAINREHFEENIMKIGLD